MYRVKICFWFLLFFIAGMVPSFAQFQHFMPQDLYGSDYVALSAGGEFFFKDISGSSARVSGSFSGDVAFLSKHLDGQLGISFGNDKISFVSNFRGVYDFSFGLNLGGFFFYNYTDYFSKAMEHDLGIAAHVSYRTKSPSWWWDFHFTLGAGTQGTVVLYKGKSLDPEWNPLWLCNLTVQTFFCDHHLIYFDLKGFENFYYTYNFGPNFSLGYNFFANKTWTISSEMEFYYSSFFTTNGLISKIKLYVGASVNFSLKK